MKKALIISSIVIVVLVGALFGAAYIVPRVIDWNNYKPSISQAVREATGRDFRIDGDLNVLLIPNIELSAAKVSLSNASGEATANMVAVDSVTTKIRFWPLLRRRVFIDEFVVRKPSISLAVDKSGKPNWVFETPSDRVPERAPEETKEPAKGGGKLPINELHLGDVKIEEGFVSYVDATTGQKLTAKGVNLYAALAGLGSPLSLEGKMMLNDRPVALDVAVDSIGGILAGERGSVKTVLSSQPVSVRYEGTVQQEPVPGLDGGFDLDIPSVGNLAAWLGRPLSRSQSDPGPLKVRARFKTDGAKATLEEATIEGKALDVKASGSFDGTGEVNKATFSVRSGIVDIDRYLPPRPPEEEKTTGPVKQAPARSGGMEALSNEPFELDRLRQTEADIEVAIGGVNALKSLGFQVGKLGFAAGLKDGVLAADLSAQKLYGGVLKGDIKLDGSSDQVKLDATVTLDGIEAAQLSKFFATDRATATGNLSANLSAAAQGASPRALAESLEAKLDGGLGGLNIKESGTISNIKANLEVPARDGLPSFKGSAAYKGERVDLEVTLDTIRKILSGERFTAKGAVTSNLLNALYDGSVQQKPVSGLDGEFRVDVPSVKKLAAWIGQPLPPSQPDPGFLKVTATFAADGDTASLQQARVEGEGIEVMASGSFDGGKEVPSVTAKLDVKKADLNAYLPEEEKKKPVAQEKTPARKEPRGTAGWSQEPLDLAGLSKIEADVEVKMASTQFRDLVIEQGRVTTKLAGGVLKTAIDQLKLADGTLAANTNIDASGQTAIVEYEISIAGVQARPLLKVFAGTDLISGRMELQAKGQAKGRSQKELVESLNGDGRIKFLDGAIHGINLAAALRQARSLGVAGGEEEKTDFAELGGSFEIKNGVLENRDFKMLAPLLRLGGQGVVPMPPRTVDYDVEAKLVPTLKGQGSQDALAGLPIPIKAKGPWDKVAYKVNWESVFKLAAQDPERLKNMPQDLRKFGESLGVGLSIPGAIGTGSVGEILKGVPGVSGGGDEKSTGQQDSQEKPEPSGAAESLKKLFGR